MLSNPDQLKAMFDMPQMQSLLGSNPQMKAMLDNPEFLSMLSNPEVINNAMGMMSGGGLGQFGMPTSNMGQNPFAQPQTFNTNTSSNQGTSSQVNWKEKYQNELKTMKDMGFFNEDVNLEVLKETGGNVDFAVEKLLSRFN